MSELMRLLFQETNAHMRTTEQKHLTISATFLTALGLAIPIVTSSGSSTPEESLRVASSLFVLAIFGLVVYGLQQWYSMWKAHYVRVAKKQFKLMRDEASMETGALPQFLQDEMPSLKVTGSADTLLNHVTMALSIALSTCAIGYSVTPVWTISNFKLKILSLLGVVGLQLLVFVYIFLKMRNFLNSRQEILDEQN